jgi:chemotaxis protein histidine kinase CheA
VDAGKQQILGFFLEEARENLDTIEQGLLSLQATIEDQEQINAVFRAAHSVKGGAAMLGMNSIQKVAHRLEDCFKILKEQPVPVDQKVESMFLRGFDTLHDLLEELQGPYGLQEEEAALKVKEVEPVFQQLQAYLNQLSAGGSGLPADFAPQATNVLRSMLQTFKQGETPSSRQSLQTSCDRLTELGGDTETWTTMLTMARQAVGSPKVPYVLLPKVLIPEIKGAIDLMQAGKAAEIAPSANLKKLAATAPATAPTPQSPEPQSAAPSTPSAAGANELVIPKDAKQAAQILIKNFDRKQLVELANLLIRAIKGQ